MTHGNPAHHQIAQFALPCLTSLNVAEKASEVEEEVTKLDVCCTKLLKELPQDHLHKSSAEQLSDDSPT